MDLNVKNHHPLREIVYEELKKRIMTGLVTKALATPKHILSRKEETQIWTSGAAIKQLKWSIMEA